MSSDLKFRALTPNTNIELHHYKEALDYVFSSSEIRNIALSGSYGSGKSSVIRSYENTYPDRTFIHISLAHFDEQGQSANTRTNNIENTSGKTDQGKTPAVKSDFEKTDSAKLVKDLEGKILNQLIHQIPPKSLPRSQRQIKSKSSKVHNILIAAAIPIFAALLIYVLWFHKWVAAVNTLSPSIVKTALLLTDTPYLRLFVVLLLLLACGAWLFYFLDTHDLQKLFKKVDFKGIIGIELFEAEDDSYFDKYLNKVLYLFDQADADAIIFEDLDRYDVTLIFEKLREINDLVYSRAKQGLRPDKKPLRFFYLIRDDVFTTADRSKFFDFIIPVVPYVDASNFCEQLLQRFDEVGLGNTFNKRFLQDVSLYLSDMRLLSNIVNEYIVYSGRLKGSGLKTQADRQLAMIIYKNIYPGDFDLLQHGRGYVFALFENKKHTIKSLSEQINSEIEEINQQITEAEHERLKSLDELNALFFPLSEEVYTINGENVGSLDRIELVKQILLNPETVRCRKYSSYVQTYQLDIKAKLKEMESNPEYSRRKTILEDKETYLQSLNRDLRALELKKQGLAVLKIQEIIDQLDEGAEKEFWIPDLPSYETHGYIEKIQNSKSFDLLKYLIRNGYIDENYAAYISYFYPKSLTAQDRNFLLALSDHTPLDYEYHLDHPDAVLNRLNLSDFTRREIRNFELLNYLLKKSHSEELHALMTTCSNNNDAYKFIIQFWRSTSYTLRFIRLIYKEQPSWFREWYESGLLKGSEWKMFVLDSIYSLSNEQLLSINVDTWLTDVISSDSAFIKIDQPDTNKLVSAFRTLNVQFPFIEYREQDLPLLREIYQKNLYALNLSMLKVFLMEYFGASELESESCSYSFLKRNPDEPLSKRVLENMDIYAEAILHESGVRFSDEEIAAIDFLNCETLSEEYKQEYIQRLDTVIDDINSIKERSLWSDLIGYRRLEYTWENIVDYFAALELDSDELPPELAEFINSGTRKLGWNYDNLNDRIGKDSASKLRRAILSNMELSLDRYSISLEGFTVEYRGGLPVTSPSDEHMKIVLKLNLLPMTVDNIEEIRKKYSHHWTNFVFFSGVDELLALMTNEEVLLSEDELTSLLEDDRITTEAAFGLMEHFDSIPLEDRVYSPEIKAKIIEAHLSRHEIPGLLRSFEQESKEVHTAFLNYVTANADIVAAGAIDAQYIPAEIYAACLSDLPPARAETLRQFIPDSNFELVCTGNCKPTFQDTVVTRTILDYFKRQRWISSYSILDNGRIRAYPTRKQN